MMETNFILLNDKVEKLEREIEKLKLEQPWGNAFRALETELKTRMEGFADIKNELSQEIKELKKKNKGLRTYISSLETALKKSKGNAASLVEEHEEEFHRVN